jgi:ABC-2 type transport system ATP-binding protein
MEEAEYCDRVVIMDAGRVLAQGTPAAIRGYGRPAGEREPTREATMREPTMEDAFIAIVEAARNHAQTSPVVNAA